MAGSSGVSPLPTIATGLPAGATATVSRLNAATIESSGIGGWNQQPGFVGNDDLRNPPCPRRYHGFSHRQGFDDHTTEMFSVRRQDKQLAERQDRPHILHPPDEPHVMTNPQRLGKFFEVPSQCTLSCQDQFASGYDGENLPPGIQQVFVAFIGHKAAHAQDDPIILRKSQRGACE